LKAISRRTFDNWKVQDETKDQGSELELGEDSFVRAENNLLITSYPVNKCWV